MARKLMGFTEEAQRLMGKSPVMRSLRGETAEVNPPDQGKPRETERAAVATKVPASSRGGRHRQIERDEIVIVVCQHLADRTDWSKLRQKDFATMLEKQFKNAVSAREIEGIIRLAKRSFPRQ
jgi:hypothetical protein